MKNYNIRLAIPVSKNLILLFLFLCVLQMATAQKNEVVLSYLPVKDQFFGTGTSLSYYRVIDDKMAMGIKTSVFGIGEDVNDYYDQDGKSVSIDIVNRYNLHDSKRFRFSTEVGLTALRRYEKGQLFFFCGNSSPQEIENMMHEYGAKKINYYGFSTAFNLEFKIARNLSFGAGYLLKAYRTNMEYHNEKTQYLSNLSLSMGVKF